MNVERNRMKACLCPAVVEVVCVSVCPCMSHCVVFILKEQLLIKMVTISGCSPHPEAELHLVNTELFMLSVWD